MFSSLLCLTLFSGLRLRHLVHAVPGVPHHLSTGPRLVVRNRRSRFPRHSRRNDRRSVLCHPLRQPKIRQDCRGIADWARDARGSPATCDFRCNLAPDLSWMVRWHQWPQRSLDRAYHRHRSFRFRHGSRLLVADELPRRYLVSLHTLPACSRADGQLSTIYAASVLAANSVLRSLFGAAFPLFVTYMYQNLGVHWATAVPGFIALVCVPLPIIFYKKGAAIRARGSELHRPLSVIVTDFCSEYASPAIPGVTVPAVTSSEKAATSAA
jgi:hypothetical protein